MHWWHVLAMDQVLETPTLLPALLGYRFHCIERALKSDRPTLLICNEFGEYLDHPLIVRKLRSWLTQVRKLNTSVWLATQNISQVTDSILAAAGNDIPTRILLPNARAVEGVEENGVGSYYARWGVNARQRELIAQAMPKRHYYFMSRHGTRLFDLRLGPVALAFCASGSAEDLARMTEMTQTSPDTFAADWLRHKHLGWAADALEQQDPPPQKGAEWTPADVSLLASVG
jgi:type IV secretion system protein VirB4